MVVASETHRLPVRKLVFSEDGEMTPLYLVTGVMASSDDPRSFTLVQPIGETEQRREKAGTEM